MNIRRTPGRKNDKIVEKDTTLSLNSSQYLLSRNLVLCEIWHCPSGLKVIKKYGTR
ncbi:hypothetical protein A2U01_0051332, partial [Trifolium medium]|nr:hypothetical protein [Trifolium medium]